MDIQYRFSNDLQRVKDKIPLPRTESPPLSFLLTRAEFPQYILQIAQNPPESHSLSSKLRTESPRGGILFYLQDMARYTGGILSSATKKNGWDSVWGLEGGCPDTTFKLLNFIGTASSNMLFCCFLILGKGYVIMVLF